MKYANAVTFMRKILIPCLMQIFSVDQRVLTVINRLTYRRIYILITNVMH